MKYEFKADKIEMTLSQVLSLGQALSATEFGSVIIDGKFREEFNRLGYSLFEDKLIITEQFNYERKSPEQWEKQIDKCFKTIQKYKDCIATFDVMVVGSEDLATTMIDITIKGEK